MPPPGMELVPPGAEDPPGWPGGGVEPAPGPVAMASISAVAELLSFLAAGGGVGAVAGVAASAVWTSPPPAGAAGGGAPSPSGAASAEAAPSADGSGVESPPQPIAASQPARTRPDQSLQGFMARRSFPDQPALLVHATQLEPGSGSTDRLNHGSIHDYRHRTHSLRRGSTLKIHKNPRPHPSESLDSSTHKNLSCIIPLAREGAYPLL